MAAGFNGTDQRLDLALEAGFDWEITTPQSYACWIIEPANGSEAFLAKAQLTGPRGLAFNTESFNGPRLGFHFVDEPNDLFVYSTDAAVFLPNFWVHAAGTYSGTPDIAGVKLYVNGVVKSAGSDSQDLGTFGTILNDSPFHIAGHEDGIGEFWEGSVAGVTMDNVQWSALQVAQISDIANFRRNPNNFLTAAPEAWLPLFASPGDAAFDLTDYIDSHTASIVGTPTVVGDPKVVIDWPGAGATGATNATFTSSTSFTHTPSVPRLKGVAVLISQSAVSTDLISAVTYGGVAMTRITNGFAQDTATEAGAAYVYYLGAGVPPGAQTVAITVSSGTDAKEAWVCGVLSAYDTQIVATGKVEGDAANPSTTLATTSTYSGLVFNVLYSGLPNIGDVVAGSGYSVLGVSRDFGANVGAMFGGNKTGANVASGWTSAIDDVAMISFAIGEVSLPIAWMRA